MPTKTKTSSKRNAARSSLARGSASDAYSREMAELAKLPRARLLSEAASAKINLRGWMDATHRAWDIVEKHGLRPDPHAETLTGAVERNLLLVAKLKTLFQPNGADQRRGCAE